MLERISFILFAMFVLAGAAMLGVDIVTNYEVEPRHYRILALLLAFAGILVALANAGRLPVALSVATVIVVGFVAINPARVLEIIRDPSRNSMQDTSGETVATGAAPLNPEPVIVDCANEKGVSLDFVDSVGEMIITADNVTPGAPDAQIIECVSFKTGPGTGYYTVDVSADQNSGTDPYFLLSRSVEGGTEVVNLSFGQSGGFVNRARYRGVLEPAQYHLEIGVWNQRYARSLVNVTLSVRDQSPFAGGRSPTSLEVAADLSGAVPVVGDISAAGDILWYALTLDKSALPGQCVGIEFNAHEVSPNVDPVAGVFETSPGSDEQEHKFATDGALRLSDDRNRDDRNAYLSISERDFRADEETKTFWLATRLRSGFGPDIGQISVQTYYFPNTRGCGPEYSRMRTSDR